MRQKRLRLVTLLGLLLAVLWPVASQAQNTHTFRVGLMAGLGGASEDELDYDLTNFSWQAVFSMRIEPSTLWGVRVGQVDLDSGADIFDSELNYLTLTGEYLYADRFYESGLYLGLGFYDFDGGPALSSDNALGVVVGVTGSFELAKRFDLLTELSIHYADLNATQFFILGHVGVGYRF